MTYILLTGAGFSHNWGGWLADETFEYLLGCPEIDAPTRNALWRSKNNRQGFEDALAGLQHPTSPDDERRLNTLSHQHDRLRRHHRWQHRQDHQNRHY